MGRFVALMALFCVPACLSRNPAYDAPEGTSTTPTGPTSTSTSSSSSSTFSDTTSVPDPTGPSTSSTTSATDSSGAMPPPQANYAFVTSVEVDPLRMGGVAGADATCNDLAQQAGLEGEYIAWVSDSSSDAIDRLGDTRGWIRPDGRPVADRIGDWADSRLLYPIRLDEYGIDVERDLVITGTNGSGRASDNCSDWTDAAGTYRSGHTDSLGPWFTSNLLRDCTSVNRLYCLGISERVELPPLPSQGRVAFVSSAAHNGGAGVEQFDATCASEAQAAGLPGTYRAFIGVEGNGPLSRFSTEGPTWVNTRGVPLVDEADDLLVTRNLNTALLYTASAETAGSSRAWTGGESPVIAGARCGDWTTSDSASRGRYATVYQSIDWVDDGTRACNESLRVLCFQE